MIGLLDSGEGGLNTCRHLHALLPKESLMLSLDYSGAPYGEKSRTELSTTVAEKLRQLAEAGVDRTLIACCTASTVYGTLPDCLKQTALPIIDPVAKAARAATENGRIAVLATSATVRSLAFPEALPECRVLQLAAGELVGAVEGGIALYAEKARELVLPYLEAVRAFRADTLILGCTHFSSLAPAIGAVLSELEGESPISVIDSAFMGAREMAKMIPRQ